MRRAAASRNRALPIFCVFALGLVAGGFAVTACAGIRGPGKYCGVVVFDRWDTCFLLSGHFITYISENWKDELRPYEGKAMQVDAWDVFQPMNPGDALIRKYEIIGPAPNTQRGAILDGLEMTAESDFGPNGTPAFWIEIRNAGGSPVNIQLSEIGPTLLGVPPGTTLNPSDGASLALITRVGLVPPSSSESTSDGERYSWSYAIDSESLPPEDFQLEPDHSMKVRITFHVPPGQYQFMFGYGGGVHQEKSLASNAISFDLGSDGVATLAK